MGEATILNLQCPVPITSRETIQMAHGGGGKLMQRLLESVIVPAFSNSQLDARHDGAVLSIGNARVAFTTDSYVVRPLFFPGGDIGTLAVNGSVNDLAMCGARPLALSCGLILEEGLPIETLERVVASMRRAADAAGVTIVTGDTKVVDRGKGDGVYINTAGIGVVEHDLTIAPSSVRPGDAVIVSGDLGRHSIAITAVRDGLEFDSEIESDCAPLAAPLLALLDAGVEVHCLRDLTRGGLASALVEIAETAGNQIEIREEAIAVREDVRGACEMLGFDPIYLANEGRFVAFVAGHDAERCVEVLRRFEVSGGAAIIGRVEEASSRRVVMKTRIGTRRIVDMLSGEQLPRIC